MKKVLLMSLIIALVMSIFPSMVFANSSKTLKLKTQSDVYKVLEKAKNGDVDAINTFRSLKAFNKEEAEKALRGIKLTAAEKVKSIKFDDGSEIVLEVRSADNVNIDSGDRKLQALEVSWYYLYKLKVLGIEVARYTIYMDYEVTGFTDDDTCSAMTSYDGGSAVFPYHVTSNGTTDITTSGEKVKCSGTAKITAFGSGIEIMNYNVKLTCYGYANYNNNYSTYVTM